jgi:PAS domain S-box-containing protein
MAARQALRASESRYRRLFETARDGILLLNADSGQIEDVNPYLVEKLGYSKAEFLGKKLWEVGPFSDIAESKEMFAQLQASGYVRYEDLPLRRKDGACFPVEFISNTYDCDGIRIAQCNIRDITERKAAEARLQRHLHFYAALSQCNKAVVHCASEQELFQQICNAAVEFGGMQGAWIGVIEPDTSKTRPVASCGVGEKHLREIVISLDPHSPEGQGPAGTAMRQNRPFWCDNLQTVPADDPWRARAARAGWESLAALPLTRNGDIVGAFTVAADVANAFDEAARDLLAEMATDISFALGNFAREAQRRQAEERLRAAEEQFRGLVEQAIAGIYIIQDGRLAYANPRAAEIVGQGSAADVIGTDPLDWIVAADRARVAKSLRRLQAGEAKSLALEFGVQRRDGVVIQVGAHAARATHDDRPAILGLLQDISEKKRAEEQIRYQVEELETALMSTVEVATIISEMRDPYTAGHERRVAEIAVAIGAELGFDVHRQEGLRVAGHLHDIGKVTVPLEILTKPGRLSPLEFELVKGHAQASYDVLKGVKFPWPVAQVALQHHERVDGSGYPQGLEGEAILLEARIMAVADVVEAMSSHRPYRPGLGIEKALAEIERGRGTVYDTDIADACLHLFREGHFQLSE